MHGIPLIKEETNVSNRFGTVPFILMHAPRPGDREQRFRPAPDRAGKRPRGGEGDV